MKYAATSVPIVGSANPKSFCNSSFSHGDANLDATAAASHEIVATNSYTPPRTNAQIVDPIATPI
jgi:hypothetical protein